MITYEAPVRIKEVKCYYPTKRPPMTTTGHLEKTNSSEYE